jgi:hypothetical protein
MNELENIPDDFWRKAFDGADERPPQDVWDAIERQLDDDSKARVLPLWGSASSSVQRALIWGTGVAASAALMLVGWWYMQSANLPQSAPSVAVHTSTNPAAATASPMASVVRRRNSPALLTHAAQAIPAGKFSDRDQRLPAKETDVAMATSTHSAIAGALVRHYATTSVDAALSGQSIAMQQATQPSQQVFSQSISLSITSVTTAPEQSASNQLSLTSTDEPAPATVQQLKNQPVLTAEAPVEVITDAAAKPIRREKWASLSIMPGAFNPAVALVSAPVVTVNNAIYQNSGYQNTAPPAVDSRSSRSMAYQLSAGIQLTDRWSVETGVGYLSAQSTVESPAQVNLASVAMLTTNDAPATNNLFIDAVRSRTAGQMNAYTAADRNTAQSYAAGRYSSSERQSVSNDYQFMQVPVQIGYQLRPRKRLGLALIGGFLTNIFVRNTVASQVVVTADNDIYRSLSWAASLGARFRYRPSQHWSASLAGLYQPTIGNSTVSDSPIRSHPTSAGMSFGVDYHF